MTKRKLPPIVECQCGKICGPRTCLNCSFIIEAARRREALKKKLKGHPLGLKALEIYERATTSALFEQVREKRLFYIGFDEVDEDWFLIRGHWGPIFDAIESKFQELVSLPNRRYKGYKRRPGPELPIGVLR